MASFFMSLGMTLEEAEYQVYQLLDAPFRSVNELISTFRDLFPQATAQDAHEFAKFCCIPSSPPPHPIHQTDVGISSLHSPLSREQERGAVVQLTKSREERAQLQIEELKKRKYKECEQAEVVTKEQANFRGKGIDDKILRIKEHRDKHITELLHEGMSGQEVKIIQTPLSEKISEAKKELDEALEKANSSIASFTPLDNPMHGASFKFSLPLRIKTSSFTNHTSLEGQQTDNSAKPAPLPTSGRLAGYSFVIARSHSSLMSARRRKPGLQWPPPKPTQSFSHLSTNDASPSAMSNPSLSNAVTRGIRQDLRPWPPKRSTDNNDQVTQNIMPPLSKSTNTPVPILRDNETSTKSTEISPTVAAIFEQATGKTPSPREVLQAEPALPDHSGDLRRRRPCRTRVAREETADSVDQTEIDATVRIPNRTRKSTRNAELLASRLQDHHNPQTYSPSTTHQFRFPLTQPDTSPIQYPDPHQYGSTLMVPLPYVSTYESTYAAPYTTPFQYPYPHQYGNTSMDPSPFGSPYESPYMAPYTSPLGLTYESGLPSADRPSYYQRWLKKRMDDGEWQAFNAEVEAARIYREKRRNALDSTHKKLPKDDFTLALAQKFAPLKRAADTLAIKNASKHRKVIPTDENEKMLLQDGLTEMDQKRINEYLAELEEGEHDIQISGALFSRSVNRATELDLMRAEAQQRLEDILFGVDAADGVESDEEMREMEDLRCDVSEISDNRSHMGHGASEKDNGSEILVEGESDEEWVGVQTPTESEDGEEWYPV